MTRRRTPSILTALNASLRAAPPVDQDTATVALAKRYALELDDAAVISKTVHKALEKLRKLTSDVAGGEDLFFELSTLAVRIEEAHVAGLIGPKLLAALEQLQLTPKARTGVLQGGGPNVGSKSKLDELRERRENRATSVDAPS